MPASKALETLSVCTCSAQSALSSGVNDDFICDKVVKKYVYSMISQVESRVVAGVLSTAKGQWFLHRHLQRQSDAFALFHSMCASL